MNENASSEITRLRCISTILHLDDEALQIVDTLLTRVAVSDSPAERKPRAKQTKRTNPATSVTTEVER
jgi:hypothetical protein